MYNIQKNITDFLEVFIFRIESDTITEGMKFTLSLARSL